ncbi:MAG TPA: hypothetical protein VD791_11755, partial [Burkholderiales bacterium]|nr:hypothetical protein [Burkholderiales bacterium]
MNRVARRPLLPMLPRCLLVLGALAALSLPARAGDVSAQAEAVWRKSFSTASPDEWAARLAQDEVNALCSKHRNNPP